MQEEFAYRVESVRPLLRHIEVLKGTAESSKLYCFDLSLSNLEESRGVIPSIRWRR